MRSQRDDLDPRVFRCVVAAVLGIHCACLALLAWITPVTADESRYFFAGRFVRAEQSWERDEPRTQGPLPSYANQIFAGEWTEEPGRAEWFRARAGIALFSLLAGLAVVVVAARMFDRTTAVCALALYASHPIVLGHGCLLSADVAQVGPFWLAVYCAWRFTQVGGMWRAAAAGVAVGGTLATKHIGALIMPVLAVALGLALIRGTGPLGPLSRRGAAKWRGLLDAALGAVLCAACAWATLWVAYRNIPAAFDAALLPLTSSFFRALNDVPLGAWALSTLPDPWVRGADAMNATSELGNTYLLGHTEERGHGAYYAIALATKSPLAILLLAPLGLLGAWQRGARAFLITAIVLPVAYLSACQALQLGVRHIVPTVAGLCLLAGRALALAWRSGRVSGAIVVATAAGSLAICHAVTWPDYVGAFNALVRRPYLWFSDSNLDWRRGVEVEQDRARLERSRPEIAFVSARCGARFGVVAARGTDLAAGASGRAEVEWLLGLRPVERHGAWFVFDASEGELRRIAADGRRKERDRVALAIALAVSGRCDEALTLVEGIYTGYAARARDAAARLQQTPGDWSALQALGQHDVVATLASAPPLARAQSLVLCDRFDAAIELIERTAAGREPSLDEALLIATAHASMGRPHAALAALDAVRAKLPAFASQQVEQHRLALSREAAVGASRDEVLRRWRAENARR